MHILFLSTENPYPPDHGHHIRTFHVLKHLAESHQVHFIGFIKSEKELRYTNFLNETCATVKLFQPPFYRNIFYTILTIIVSFFKGLPLNVYRYYTTQAARYIEIVCKKYAIQIIHVDLVHLAIYEKHFHQIRRFLTEHNVEYIRLSRWADIEKKLWKKAILKIQAKMMKRFEKINCPKYDHCFVVSDADKNILASLCKTRNFEVIPNGVDIDYFQQKDKAIFPRSLVWIGGMESPYNRNAIEYFIKDVWPILKNKLIDIHLIIVGSHPPRILSELARHNPHIILTGYVEDVREYMRSNSIFIAPIRSGSGTKIKILNAMAMGMPVVTTSIGAEGIDAINNREILIADHPEEFAEKVQQLWDDEKLAKRIGISGQRLVVEEYSWQQIFKIMDKYYI